MVTKTLESIASILSATVRGLVAYYMFNGFVNHKNSKKNRSANAQEKESSPIKLKVYERLLLFCDRINPVKMLLRIPPISENTNAYLHLFI